ncbi:resolvase [Methylobacterium nonmethylotrophicum]|uniref:Resolvase n=2 Tax=Methylobacterium nonmethylotrophicum TaxID=1141884 RepID=A0A4Z0NE53_9HYPH|nr:resolvase [Methylobacterium nonmethylotrophicum]
MAGKMKTGIDPFACKGRQTSIQVRRERARQHAAHVTPVINEVRAGGAMTLRAVADALNARGIPTARGRQWSATQVRRVMTWTA